MTRIQRLASVFLIFLLFPAYLWAERAENGTISTTATGITMTLCQGGTPAAPTWTSAFVAIMDNPVWVTMHNNTATPSPTVGFLVSPGQTITVPRANHFRAVRQGALDARFYAMCIE
jgi:hypothetical protein